MLSLSCSFWVTHHSTSSQCNPGSKFQCCSTIWQPWQYTTKFILLWLICVLPWLPHYKLLCCKSYISLVMWNGHIETLMLMEWYIALFTCKTTADCVFYMKCITCRHYLDVGTGGRPGHRGHVPPQVFSLCYVRSMYTTKIKLCTPINKSSLYVT